MKLSKNLAAKIERYNSISEVKIKINSDAPNIINIYSEDNHFIISGKLSQVDLVLDALITVKRLEQR